MTYTLWVGLHTGVATSQEADNLVVSSLSIKSSIQVMIRVEHEMALIPKCDASRSFEPKSWIAKKSIRILYQMFALACSIQLGGSIHKLNSIRVVSISGWLLYNDDSIEIIIRVRAPMYVKMVYWPCDELRRRDIVSTPTWSCHCDH